MIQSIAIHEFRSMLRERRFRLAALLLSSLFLFALLGAYDYRAQIHQQHTEAAEAARVLWENQGEVNPHSAAHYGTHVFKPVHPLAFFERGVDAYTGNTLFLEAHRMNEAQHRAAADRHNFARLGTLTPAFILGLLFPVFIIVLGFGAVAGEREGGNLRLLLAQGLRPTALFFGKALGLWYAVLLLALPFFALGGIGLLQTGVAPDDWVRYGLLVAGYLLYLGCFVHLTLLLSALTKHTNTALVAALGTWMLICLLVPKAATNVARWQHPTPAWQAYHEAIEEDLKNGVDGHDPADDYTENLKQETLKQYGVDSVQHLPFNWAGFVMQKGEEHETYVFQKHKDNLLDIYTRQQGIHEAASVASPYLLAGIASQRLAGTDVGSYFDFLAAAEKYRIQLVGDLNNDLKDNFKYGDWEGKRDKAFFASNVRFEYRPPALGAVLADVQPALAALAAWFLLSGLVCLFFFQKIKPV